MAVTSPTQMPPIVLKQSSHTYNAAAIIINIIYAIWHIDTRLEDNHHVHRAYVRLKLQTTNATYFSPRKLLLLHFVVPSSNIG